jgi:hypothetical protein
VGDVAEGTWVGSERPGSLRAQGGTSKGLGVDARRWDASAWRAQRRFEPGISAGEREVARRKSSRAASLEAHAEH